MWNNLFWLLGASVVAAEFPRMPRALNGTLASNSTSTASSSIITSTRLPTGTVTLTSATSEAATNTASDEYEFPSDKLGPIATLLPAVPNDHDIYDIEHLSPHDKGTGAPLHYAGPVSSDNAGTFAIAIPRWQYPSIVLDHSGLVIDINMNANKDLVMTFVNKDAFDHSQTRWVDGDMVFVSYTEGCGDYDLSERCYFHAKEVSFDLDSLSASARGESVRIQDVVEDVNLAWGNYGSSLNAGQPSVAAPVATTANAASPSSTSTSLDVQPPKCVAPVDSKYNLPTVCTGPYFDQELDDELGIFHADDVPGTAGMIVDLFDGDDLPLGKRIDFSPKALWSKGKEKVANAYENTKKTLKATGQKVASGIDKSKKTLVQQGQAFVSNVKKGIDTTKKVLNVIKNIWEGKPQDFSLGKKELKLPLPRKDCEEKAKSKDPKERERIKNACQAKAESKAKAVESPWGEDALLIKSFGDAPKSLDLRPKGSSRQTTVTKGKFINFYCVNCGVTGSLDMAGNITINGLKGITNGKVEGRIDVSVGLGLGVYAQYTREDKFTRDLYNIPLSPFTVGFATIGPMLAIGTEMKYSVNMEGSALARGDVKFTNARFHYDYVSGKMGYVNFKPEFTPSFTAEGSVTLAAQFGVPLGLEVGLTFFEGCQWCKGSIGISTTPAIKAAATIAVEASGNLTIPLSGKDKNKVMDKNIEAGLKATNNCTGISTTISVLNDLAGKLKGFGLVNKEWPIHKTPDYILASYCIGNKTDGTSKGRIGWQGAADSKDKDKDKDKRAFLDGVYPHGLVLRQVEAQLDTDSETTDEYEIYDLTDYVVEEKDQVEFSESSLEYYPYDLYDEEFPGFWYSTISVETGDDVSPFILAACNDGNVYVQKKDTPNNLPWYVTCTTLWAGLDDAVLQSPDGGILHYYNNTMSVAGISRLRYASEETVPGGSVYIGLAPYYYETDDDESQEGPSMLVAVDPEENILFPVVCTYKDGQGAKIYLISSDVEDGLAKLESPDFKYSITNGDVDQCNLLMLSVTDYENGDWVEYDEDAEAEYLKDPIEWEFDDSMAIGADGDLELPDALLELDDDSFNGLDDIFDDDWFGEDLDLLSDEEFEEWLNELEPGQGDGDLE